MKIDDVVAERDKIERVQVKERRNTGSGLRS